MPRFVAFTSLGRRALPNQFDLFALAFIFAVLIAIVHASHGALLPLKAPGATDIHLSVWYLPYYALRTTLRMFIAMAFSLLFTFTYATIAAKSERAEKVLIPLLDVLQSVPILGFLAFLVVFFVNMFPGSVAGYEAACIFAIFTSQAWNMAFSFYQSLRNVPADLIEVSNGFRLYPVATLLAAGDAVRDARPHLEHDDVDVGWLVLRRRFRSDRGGRQHHQTARHRVVHRSRQFQVGLRRHLRGCGDDGHRHSRV